jgi:cobalt/nickel transport protein
MRTEIMKTDNPSVKWFDGFTKTVLLVMFLFLAFIFFSAKYMTYHKMEAGGTDDTVNSMASKVSGTTPHPFVDLPGDAQLGAFSIANLCVGLIIGHLWTNLFGKNAEKQPVPQLRDAKKDELR